MSEGSIVRNEVVNCMRCRGAEWYATAPACRHRLTAARLKFSWPWYRATQVRAVAARRPAERSHAPASTPTTNTRAAARPVHPVVHPRRANIIISINCNTIFTYWDILTRWQYTDSKLQVQLHRKNVHREASVTAPATDMSWHTDIHTMK